MRVLYLCTYLDEATGRRYGKAWAQAGLNKKRGVLRALKFLNHDVRVVSPVALSGRTFVRHPRYVNTDETVGVTVTYPAVLRSLAPISSLYLLYSTMRTILRVRRERAFDVVLFYNWDVAVAIPALLCKLLFRSRIVLEYEDGLFVGGKRASVRVAARLLSATMNRILDGAIVNSRNFLELLECRNIGLVRGVVDVPDQPAASAARAEDDGRTIVMYAGKIDEVRGADLFVAAAAHLTGEPNIEFWITGQGDEKLLQSLRERLANGELPNVRYLGFLPYADYREKLARADVLVSAQKPELPFSRYCFPSKLIEYMATGKVVIATAVSDVHAVAEHGVVLSEASPERLAGTILDVVANLRAHTAKGAVRIGWVKQNCSIEAAARQLDLVLANAMRAGTQEEALCASL